MDAAQLTGLLNLVALVVIMVAMGLRVELSDVSSSARRWQLVGLALLANYVAVPVVTLLLLQVFQADPFVSAGFLILAVCPGAPVAPPLAVLAKGNLPSAIGLMVILAGLSAFLAPLLLSVLLTRLTPDGDLRIDHLAILRTLLLAQMLPLAIGLAVRKAAPRAAERIAKPIGALANLLLIGLLVLILVSQFQTLAAIRLRGWIGMGLLLAFSLGIGWVCGGKARGTQITLAVTTAVRNAAVGLVIAANNFSGTPAVTAVVAYGVVSLLGALAFAMFMGRAESCAAET